jgi:hypothetical protein
MHRKRLFLEPLESRLCPALTLTQAGINAGFRISNFAVDFPSIINIGPLGIAFPSNGGVLVTDFPGNVRLFPTDTDAQSAAWYPPSRNYGVGNALGLAQVGDAIYLASQQGGAGVYQLNADGTLIRRVVTLAGAEGIVANPGNGHLFVSTTQGLISDVNPIANPPTSTVFVNRGSTTNLDGLTISADGSILYVAIFGGTANGHTIGFNTKTGSQVFDSGFISGGPDGVAEGTGLLAGNIFVNTNDGHVWEVNIANVSQHTMIASGGSRGDFVTVDPHDGSLLVTQSDRIVRLKVPPSPTTSFRISAPASVVAGKPFAVTVTALDAYGRVATGYTGTVTFTSSDAYPALLPSDYTFTAADQGTHAFGASLFTAGGQTLTVADKTNSSIKVGTPVAVQAAPANHFLITTAPSTLPNTPFDVRVTALDPYSNVDPSYTGTVTFSSADPAGATLPASYTFTVADHGVHTFAKGVTLYTTGTWDVTATDTANRSIAGTATVHVSGPSIRFAPAVNYPVGATPQSVTVGDFNGDGKPDLAVVNLLDGTVSVLLGNGDGTFQPRVNYAAGAAPWAVAVGDFNGDGKQDLVVANRDSNDVSVLLGNGDGTFQGARSFPAGSGPQSVAVGDFNDDGKPDLAVADHTSNTVSVLFGNGDGTFQNPVSYGVGSDPFSVVVGDFNQDGKPDLAVANNNFGSASTVSILLNKGNGTFASAVNSSVGIGSWAVVVGDFNRDGKQDLAVANANGQTISILLGKGNGTFQNAVDYSAGTGTLPYSITVADFDHNGTLDLAVANNQNQTVSVLLGNGDGTFQSPVAFNVGLAPVSVVAADLNRDGYADLVVANQGSNSVSVLLNQGRNPNPPGGAPENPTDASDATVGTAELAVVAGGLASMPITAAIDPLASAHAPFNTPTLSLPSTALPPAIFPMDPAALMDLVQHVRTTSDPQEDFFAGLPSDRGWADVFGDEPGVARRTWDSVSSGSSPS